jgi:transposase-like protein
MVQDYSTINILDQFETTHYRLLITVLPIHSRKITPWQPQCAWIHGIVLQGKKSAVELVTTKNNTYFLTHSCKICLKI